MIRDLNELFHEAVSSNARLYVDCSFLMDTYFRTDFYPALVKFNKSSGTDKVFVDVLSGCINQLKNCIRRGVEANPVKEQNDPEKILELLRRNSDRKLNFRVYESPDTTPFGAEIFARACSDKTERPVYIFTESFRLMRDMKALDNAGSFCRKDDVCKYHGKNYPVTTFTYDKLGQLHSGSNPILRSRNSELPSSTGVPFDFDMFATMGAKIFIDCNFMVKPAFRAFNESLTAFNSKRVPEDRLQISILPTVDLELNRCALNEKFTDREAISYAINCLRDCKNTSRDSNYVITKGVCGGCFFDADFLSTAVLTSLSSPVVILTGDLELRNDTLMLSRLESFRNLPIYAYGYGFGGVVCRCNDTHQIQCYA